MVALVRMSATAVHSLSVAVSLPQHLTLEKDGEGST